MHTMASLIGGATCYTAYQVGEGGQKHWQEQVAIAQVQRRV
jgi:hypothetical protein